MSAVIRPVILLTLGLLTVGNETYALDLDNAITLPDAPVTLPITEAKGWYLRGDISTSFKTLSSSPSFSTFSGVSYSSGTVTSSQLKENDLSGGVGVGYRFNDIFRADATVDISTGSASLAGIGADTCPGAPGGTCSISTSGKFTNYTVMANAYVDIATIAKFTPYVGAGIGATQVNWGDFSGTGTCIGGGCGGFTSATINNSGLTQWRATWALMAGVSYDLSERAKLDIGYRYSRIPGGEMYSYDSTSVGSGASGAQARDGGFDRHEVRAGIRITGW